MLAQPHVFILPAFEGPDLPHKCFTWLKLQSKVGRVGDMSDIMPLGDRWNITFTSGTCMWDPTFTTPTHWPLSYCIPYIYIRDFFFLFRTKKYGRKAGLVWYFLWLSLFWQDQLLTANTYLSRFFYSEGMSLLKELNFIMTRQALVMFLESCCYQWLEQKRTVKAT